MKKTLTEQCRELEKAGKELGAVVCRECLSINLWNILYGFLRFIRGAFVLFIMLALMISIALLMGEFFEFVALQLGLKKTDGILLGLFTFIIVVFIAGSFGIGNEITHGLKKQKRRKRLWAAMNK